MVGHGQSLDLGHIRTVVQMLLTCLIAVVSPAHTGQTQDTVTL